MTKSNLEIEQVMVSLLGRIAFPEEKLKELITKNKKKAPEAYVRGYNACDGKNTVTDIAKIIGVSQATLTPILQDWESKGIIYAVDSNKGRAYMRLYSLPNLKEKIIESENKINESVISSQPEVKEVAENE